MWPPRSSGRGWADLGNYASDLKGVPLTPGKAYTITLDLAATDHVVPAGRRLALIVAGTDKDLIDPPSTTPTLTLDLSVRRPACRSSAAPRPSPRRRQGYHRRRDEHGRPRRRTPSEQCPPGPGGDPLIR